MDGPNLDFDYAAVQRRLRVQAIQKKADRHFGLWLWGLTILEAAVAFEMWIHGWF